MKRRTRRGHRTPSGERRARTPPTDLRGHVSLNLGILLALACAIATQLGFLYKHKGANEAPTVDIRRPFRTAKQLYSCKWFAIGMAVASGAWFFHVAALAFAALSVVQAVLPTRAAMPPGLA